MKKKRAAVLTIIGIISITMLLFACGRTVSRLGGKEHRQVLKVENFKEFISISFDKRGASTVKDVTFLAIDGFAYTREFMDVSPFEGVIRWVPYGKGDDFIQSRAISRWTGNAVNLELPEDCTRILGVDVSYLSKNERVKNLTYLSTDGAVYSKEYREGLIDRNFEGWLEVRAK
ncbi:MAG: hypothetical protein KKE61_22990 [Proteobacteria bacterium]|nr:hypothetical protein [Pseudomonadota bacterium]